MTLFEEFQDKLQSKLDYIDESNVKECHAKPVRPWETVVGNVADDTEIKALYAMCLDMSDEIKDLEDEHDAVCPPEPGDKDYHDNKLFQLIQTKGEFSITKKVMWLAIKRKFEKELTGKEHLGLREHWQIVYIDYGPDLRTTLTIASPFGGPFPG